MKKLVGIFLFAFIIVVGFSGTVSATDIPSFHGKFLYGPSSMFFAPHTFFKQPNIVSATVINNPGATIAGGKIISITGGQTIGP